MTPRNRMTEYFREHPEFCNNPIVDPDSCTYSGDMGHKPFGIIGTPDGLFDLEGNPIDFDDSDGFLEL